MTIQSMYNESGLTSRYNNCETWTVCSGTTDASDKIRRAVLVNYIERHVVKTTGGYKIDIDKATALTEVVPEIVDALKEQISLDISRLNISGAFGALAYKRLLRSAIERIDLETVATDRLSDWYDVARIEVATRIAADHKYAAWCTMPDTMLKLFEELPEYDD